MNIEAIAAARAANLTRPEFVLGLLQERAQNRHTLEPDVVDAVRALLDRLIGAEQLLIMASEVIEEAMTSHIYDDSNGERPEEDCAYQGTVDGIAAFLSGAPPESRVVIYVKDGIVEDIVTDTPLPSKLRVVVIDADADGADDYYEHDGRNVCVSVHEPDFKAIDWDKDFLLDGEAPDNPISEDGFTPAMAAALLDGTPEAPPTIADLWKAFDGRMAFREGWGVFESDRRGLEIQADGDRPQFVRNGSAYDEEAEDHVRNRASGGSLYHAYALAIHDRQAADHRRVAEALGYKVLPLAGLGFQAYRENGRTEGSDLTRDDGEPFRFQREAAAWTSCYMDAGARGLLEDE